MPICRYEPHELGGWPTMGTSALLTLIFYFSVDIAIVVAIIIIIIIILSMQAIYIALSLSIGIGMTDGVTFLRYQPALSAANLPSENILAN